MPDYDAPVIINSQKNTVEDFCMQIHKGIMNNFKYAFVWGSSARHNPQRVGKDHVLKEYLRLNQ